MLRRLMPLVSASLLLAMTGCGVRRIEVPVAAVPRGMAAATLSQLALVVPVPPSAGPTVATRWDHARVTIGNHAGALPDMTLTYLPNGSGLQAPGSLPALPPGPGYWLRVELIASQADGSERVIGRGEVGLDDDGVELVAGPNAAALPIAPTQAGTQIAFAPATTASQPARAPVTAASRRQDSYWVERPARKGAE